MCRNYISAGFRSGLKSKPKSVISIIALIFSFDSLATQSVTQKITCLGHNENFWSWYAPSLKGQPQFKKVYVGSSSLRNVYNVCLLTQNTGQIYCFGTDFGKKLVQVTHDDEPAHSMIYNIPNRYDGDSIDILTRSGHAYKIVLLQKRRLKKWIRVDLVDDVNGQRHLYKSIYGNSYGIDFFGRAISASGFFPNPLAQKAKKIIPFPSSVWVQYYNGQYLEFVISPVTQLYIPKNSNPNLTPVTSISNLIPPIEKISQQYGEVVETQATATSTCLRFQSGRVVCNGLDILWANAKLKKIKEAISVSMVDGHVCVLENQQTTTASGIQ